MLEFTKQDRSALILKLLTNKHIVFSNTAIIKTLDCNIYKTPLDFHVFLLTTKF